ncbi:pullulanase X25 domain-containing protein, partial [Phycicoccus elongatus]|uniref:pullulanase X25 domain-containing protein n=1 Tax=Phycicoccus elongatus TaxID=101689 RepID=UPI002C3BA87F
DFFSRDDWYTDADSNAYQSPTFLGNHDMGRAAMFLQDSAANDAELMQRVKFANALMFTTRGNPVTYYGDEQGFIGTGGDQLAREDMFASKVDIYNNEKVLGGPSGSMDRYNTKAPLYTWIKALSAARAEHPALADGAQINRYAAEGSGLFVVSRYDRDSRREYVVAANNATTPQTVTIDTWTKQGNFKPVLGTDAKVKSGHDGAMTVTVPPLTVSVWAGNKPIDGKVAAPTSTLAIAPGATVSGRQEVRADVKSDTFAQTTFLYRLAGAKDWLTIGTDDNAPFRVFHDVSGMPLGSVLEYRAVTRDAAGRVAASGSWAVVGKAQVGGGEVENGDPVTQPSSVAIAGTLNGEMGCPHTPLGNGDNDWEPDCDQAQLHLDGNDQIWKGTWTLPAGPYGYKAALNRSWTENYGAKGEKEGGNIDFETTDGTVSFYYDHATHWVTSDEEGPIITAPGTFQSELGCSADWAPACMRPWLQDKDGDGVYTWSTKLIPAGSWNFKIAHGLSWTENYGDGGVRDGGEMTVTVPSAGSTTTFRYDSATHLTSVTSQ